MDVSIELVLFWTGAIIWIGTHFRIMARAFHDELLWGFIVFALPFGELAYWAKARRVVAPMIYAQMFGALLMVPYYATKPLSSESGKNDLSQVVDVPQEEEEIVEKTETSTEEEKFSLQNILLQQREELNRTEGEISLAWFGMLKQKRLLYPLLENDGETAYRNELAAYELMLRHANREKVEIRKAWDRLGQGNGKRESEN